MSKLVVYGNDFNFMPLPKLTELQIDIFMKIVSELKESRELEYPFMDFYFDFYHKRHSSIAETTQAFYKLADDLLIFNVKYSVKDRHYAFICFEQLELDTTNSDKPILKIKAQEKFFELITNLQLGFTKFELKEFMSIKGKYAKSLYRLLKQFRNTGKVLVYNNNWEEFHKIMQIPENYTQSKIDERILKPAIKELSKYFNNLTYKKIKNKKRLDGQGGKVIGIEFYFEAEKEPTEVKEKTSKSKIEPKTKSKKIPIVLSCNEEEYKESLKKLNELKQQGVNIGTIIIK